MEKKKGIMDYIFQFAGTYKSAYIKSVIFAVIGVIFSLIPYILEWYFIPFQQILPIVQPLS